MSNLFDDLMAAFSGICISWVPVSSVSGCQLWPAVPAKGMPAWHLYLQMAFNGDWDSCTYLACLCLVLAGYFMETGGAVQTAGEFCASLVGNIHGGLGNYYCAGLCFLSTRYLSGLSSRESCRCGEHDEFPPMIKRGYDRDFSGVH